MISDIFRQAKPHSVQDFQLDVFRRSKTTTFLEHRIRTNNGEYIAQLWHPIREIGSGGFGTVHSEREEKSGGVRAVKTIEKRPLEEYGIDWTRELEVMAKLANFPDMFVRFMGWFDTGESVAIAMELFEEGDLQSYLENNCAGQPRPEDEAREITVQVLEGLTLMHQLGIAHRDLKPGNIFIASIHPKLHIKIGDFGVSKHTRPANGTRTQLRTRQIFTLGYAAPELMYPWGDSYSFAIDIWALGITVFQILNGGGYVFFDDDAQHEFCDGYDKANPLERLQKRRQVSDAGVKFIEKLLQPDPTKRPSAKAALELSWVSTRAKERAIEKIMERAEKERELEEFKMKLEGLDEALREMQKNLQIGKALQELEAFKEQMGTKLNVMEMRYEQKAALDSKARPMKNIIAQVRESHTLYRNLDATEKARNKAISDRKSLSQELSGYITTVAPVEMIPVGSTRGYSHMVSTHAERIRRSGGATPVRLGGPDLALHQERPRTEDKAFYTRSTVLNTQIKSVNEIIDRHQVRMNILAAHEVFYNRRIRILRQEISEKEATIFASTEDIRNNISKEGGNIMLECMKRHQELQLVYVERIQTLRNQITEMDTAREAAEACSQMEATEHPLNWPWPQSKKSRWWNLFGV